MVNGRWCRHSGNLHSCLCPPPAGFTLTDAMTLGSLNQPAVRLRPGMLVPGLTYEFQLCANATQVQDGSDEYACGQAQVIVAKRASIGRFACTTASGSTSGQELNHTFGLQVAFLTEEGRAPPPPPEVAFRIPPQAGGCPRQCRCPQ